jgi:hypothetical protein
MEHLTVAELSGGGGGKGESNNTGANADNDNARVTMLEVCVVCMRMSYISYYDLMSIYACSCVVNVSRSNWRRL